MAGEYSPTLIITSAKGCKDTFELAEKIIVSDESYILVPNAFSPNISGSPGNTFNATDLSNDIFHALCKGVDKFEMNIFTRWGELVYKTENLNEGWDGYFKEKLCTKDIYVWKITATFIDGKTYNKAGDLLLVR